MQTVETHKPAGRRFIQGMIGAFLILPVIGVTAVLLMGRPISPRQASQLLPVYGTAADFTLTERSGLKLSRQDFLNSVWVADFVFTHCAGQCPLMTMAMSRLQKTLPPGVRLASFSVDPKRDTPDVLSQYADNYGAEKGKWFFLTGPFEEISRVAASFYMNQGEDPNIHSTRFVLLDRQAKIRGYYDQTDPKAMEKLVQDAASLLS